MAKLSEQELGAILEREKKAMMMPAGCNALFVQQLSDDIYRLRTELASQTKELEAVARAAMPFLNLDCTSILARQPHHCDECMAHGQCREETLRPLLVAAGYLKEEVSDERLSRRF